MIADGDGAVVKESHLLGNGPWAVHKELVGWFIPRRQKLLPLKDSTKMWP